jgi:glycosyltransferase involved in cell wall biosynthesis
MNVIHTLAWYFPESTGGTEIYVAELVKELRAFGVAGRIAAPRAGRQPSDYVHDGVDVYRYAFAEGTELATARSERPPQNFQAFVAWLNKQPRGIYHQHSWTTSCGYYHLSAAKSLGFKTVLTVHVPGNICLRGTMMEFGRDPCDGRVEAVRCASCWAQGRGLPRAVASVLSRVPRAISHAAYQSGAENRLLTALSARELAAARQRQIAMMAGASDRVVVVCDWLAQALRKNGIAKEKLVLNRQGVGRDFITGETGQRGSTDKFRLGFLGRCDPVKGLHVLLDAVKRMPRNIDFELIIHTLANTEPERRYREALIMKAAGDPRISFMPPVARADLPAVLGSFDMLAVPSQWQETGPLVILEAQAVGVPVLGSNLGGIAELVSPGLDGYLVAFSDPEAWADAIGKAVTGVRPSIGKIRTPRPVRTMADVGRDMAALYAEVA